jgi:hypothetical protein
VPAIHVKEISWFNDDIMPFDQLVNSGLTVTLDHAVTSPVDGGNFIVTLEPTVSQPAASATAFFRAIQVLDSQVVSNDRVLSWLPALDPSTQVAIQGTLSAGVPPASFARTRVRVRLVGQMFFANGPEGLLHLDGKALGQSGTRADVSTPRTDLRFPSGDGSKASDLESWFYLAPAQQVSAAIDPADLNSNFKELHLWAIFDGGFHVAVPSNPKQPVSISVTVSLLYPALADVTVSLELSADPTDVTTSGVSVPSSVVIPRGQQKSTIAVTISSFPTPPAPPKPLPPDVHFTVTASLTLAVSSLSSKADVNFYIGYPPDFRLANPPGAVGGGVLPGGPVMRG